MKVETKITEVEVVSKKEEKQIVITLSTSEARLVRIAIAQYNSHHLNELYVALFNSEDIP